MSFQFFDIIQFWHAVSLVLFCSLVWRIAGACVRALNSDGVVGRLAGAARS